MQFGSPRWYTPNTLLWGSSFGPNLLQRDLKTMGTDFEGDL